MLRARSTVYAGLRTAAFLLLAVCCVLPASRADAATTTCACKRAADPGWSCLNIDSETLTQNKRVNGACALLPSLEGLKDTLKGWTCQPDPLSVSKSKPVPQGGICVGTPMDAYAVNPESEAISRTEGNKVKDVPIVPVLNTAIPGFEFDVGDERAGQSSLLAQYIVGLYRYVLSIVAVAATVMFTFGAFKYLLGSAIPSVKRGKEIMQESIIGMLLVIAAHLILRTVNPNTLNLSVLDVTPIKPERAIHIIPASVSMRLFGGNPPSRREMLDLGKKLGAETGMPEVACLVYASMVHESGGRMDVIGHDENFQSTNYDVKARKSFLQSGTKYSGATFTAIPCTNKDCQTASELNDDVDTFDPTRAPEYGLDWRFSHGFGASQSTVFPESRPCSGRESAGRGFRMGSDCYTIPELMTPEGNVGVMVQHFKSVFLQAGKDPAKAFVSYAGNITSDNPAIVSRMKVYNKCMGQEAE